MTDHGAVLRPRTGQSPLRAVALHDGTIATLRGVTATDEAALHALMLRDGGAGDAEEHWFVAHLLLSARNGDTVTALIDEQIVGVAGFARLERDPAVADVAALVDAAHQGEGLGPLLIGHLSTVARSQGVRSFVAVVPADNPALLRLLKDSGFAADPGEAPDGLHLLQRDLSTEPR